jgi:hypothetical protein
MKYLCLVYFNEQEFWENPESPKDVECFEHAQKLMNSGHFIAGTPLEPVATATTVRVRNGKPIITDGPFAETKEQLAGFYMIEAKDLDEALGIASRIPPARVGSIEVRPLRELKV